MPVSSPQQTPEMYRYLKGPGGDAPDWVLDYSDRLDLDENGAGAKD